MKQFEKRVSLRLDREKVVRAGIQPRQTEDHVDNENGESDAEDHRQRDGERRYSGNHQSGGERRRKIKVTGIDEFLLDHESVRLGQVEQLADREQTAALGYALLYLEEKVFDGKTTLREAVERLWELLEKEGLEVLAGGGRTVPSLAMPRIQEIFACVSRYRGLRF